MYDTQTHESQGAFSQWHEKQVSNVHLYN